MLTTWVTPASWLRPGLGSSLVASVWCGVAPPCPWPDSRVCVMCRQLDKIEGVFERPSDEVIRELSRALRQALGVSLFGIDIIINNQTGQHAVIDINAFPGERAVGTGDPGQATGRALPPAVCEAWGTCSPHKAC